MNSITNIAKAVLLTLLTGLPFAAHAGPVVQGGADGGGGYQYPNAKLLLKVVSQPLAKDIEQMSDAAFKEFPKTLGRAQLADIIRRVVSLPAEYRERENADGEMEGLMFDYDRNYCDQQGCGPRILALKPFFDAYKGLPVKILEAQKEKEPIYAATRQDVRERLIHEAAHLLDIGTTARTDVQGDEFSKRLQNAMNAQYYVCKAEDWVSVSNTQLDILKPAFVLHIQSGVIGWTGQRIGKEEYKSVADGIISRVHTNIVRNGGGNSFIASPEAQNHVSPWKPNRFSVNQQTANVNGGPIFPYIRWEADNVEFTIDIGSGVGSWRMNWGSVKKSQETRMICHLASPTISLKF